VFSKISAIVYVWIMETRIISSMQIQALLIPSADYIEENVNIFFGISFNIYNLILISLCIDHKKDIKFPCYPLHLFALLYKNADTNC